MVTWWKMHPLTNVPLCEKMHANYYNIVILIIGFYLGL